MMIFYIVLLIIFSLNNLFAQNNYFLIDSVEDTNNVTSSESVYFSFPVLKCDVDSKVADKINIHLQLSELGLIKGHEKNNIFERVRYDKPSTFEDDYHNGKMDILFQIFKNDNKVLSIKLNESGCGATYSSWIQYYNFNSGNGDLIQLSDLFTDQGYTEFRKKIISKRTETFIKDLDLIISDDKDYFIDILDRIKDDDLNDFYFSGDSIIIDGENCLYKYEKTEDYNMVSSYALKEFQDYLNEYGKVLFYLSNEKINKFRSKSIPQLFSGFIDEKYPIMMIFSNNNNNDISGQYMYLKHGIGIELRGTIENNTLNLTEYDDDNDVTGYIKAEYDNEKIFGTWKNKELTKTLKISLKRY